MGLHSIRIQDQILLRKFVGQWNYEQYQSYSESLDSIINNVSGRGTKKWAAIADMREWKVSTFDIYDHLNDEAMKEAYIKDINRGLSCEALLFSDMFHYEILKRNTNFPKSFPVGFFFNTNDLIQWMIPLGFDPTEILSK